MNASQFNKTPYSFEFPIPSTNPRLPHVSYSIKCTGYATIKECVAACKAKCADFGVNYDDREVKLFMTDADGKWEVTEEGELAN